MPLIIPKTLPAYDALYEENVFVMHRERAASQHIRPLEILILNLMPTKIATETQIARLLANTPQVFGHLSRGAAGMFAHVDHKIHHAKAQAKLLQLLGGVGCEPLVKLHRVEGYGRLDHSLHLLYLTRSSIITLLDKVKYFFQKISPCSVFLFREQGENDFFLRPAA